MRENTYKNILRLFIISLMAIMLFFSSMTSVTSPSWDKGELSWTEDALDFIKSDVTQNGYEGNILIGEMSIFGIVSDYSISIRDLNSTQILKLAEEKYSDELAEVDFEKIDVLKPDYLILDEAMYLYYFDKSLKKQIFQDYKIVFRSQSSPYRCLVLKRLDIQPHESLYPLDGKYGQISTDAFNISIPSVMKIGKVSTALVQVRNTGNSKSNFIINVHSKKNTIFVDEEWRNITLDKGSVYTLKFKIVPYKEYIGELPITIDLYAKCEDNGTWIKVDSSSDYVYLIEK